MVWRFRVYWKGTSNQVKRRRNTVQRQLILDAIAELDIHATAEQVVAHLLERQPAIGRATVYRNLNYMAESGEILKIASIYGSTHYDHNCHDHSHFICGSCKRVIDIEGDYSDIASRPKNTVGFDITGCHVSFSGICWDCKAEK